MHVNMLHRSSINIHNKGSIKVHNKGLINIHNKGVVLVLWVRCRLNGDIGDQVLVKLGVMVLTW